MTDADDEVASKRSVIAKSDDGGGVGVDTGEGYHEDGQVTQVEEDEDGGAGCVRRNRRRKRSIEVGDEGRMRKRSIEMDDDAVITKADEEAEVEEGKKRHKGLAAPASGRKIRGDAVKSKKGSTLTTGVGNVGQGETSGRRSKRLEKGLVKPPRRYVQ